MVNRWVGRFKHVGIVFSMFNECSGAGWHAAGMDPSLVLVHSPFVGPASWGSTAHALRSRGRRVHVPSMLAVAASRPPYWPVGVAAIADAVSAGEQVVLVPHSNAGLYVPAVVEALGDQIRGVVFVDAALPGTGQLTTPDFLAGLATVDGLLPPWTSWWDEQDVAPLFPDPAVRAVVEAEQPRMPLAYYGNPPPAPAGWATETRCGYIWFGEPYDAEAAQAAELGWPTTHVPGTHLHMLTDPDGVAAAVLQIAADWR